MALIDISGVTRGVGKLGNAVVMTVQPVANIIEMASESSSAWALAHSANLNAKTERQTKVREQTHADLLRKAMATAQQATIDTNIFERQVQTAVGIDAAKGALHKIRLSAICNLDPVVLDSLARKENLTDADILRAAKIGSVAKPIEEEESKQSAFDISQFTTK